jgi:hypothetical protein
MPQGELIAINSSRVMKPVPLDGFTTSRHAITELDMDVEGNPLCPISATPPSDTSAATSIESSSVKYSGPSSGPNRRRIFSSNASGKASSRAEAEFMAGAVPYTLTISEVEFEELAELAMREGKSVPRIIDRFLREAVARRRKLAD